MKWTYSKALWEKNEARGREALIKRSHGEARKSSREQIVTLFTRFPLRSCHDLLPQYSLGWVLTCMCIILLPVTGAKWSHPIFPNIEGPPSVRLSTTSTKPLWQLILHVFPMSLKVCDNPGRAVPLQTLLSWQPVAVVKKSPPSNGRKHRVGPGYWLATSPCHSRDVSPSLEDQVL